MNDKSHRCDYLSHAELGQVTFEGVQWAAKDFPGQIYGLFSDISGDMHILLTSLVYARYVALEGE